MSRKASQFQKKVMSLGYRGREIFKPLNTGRIDEHVACVREWIANIFFYTKNGTTIMIDAGYNYDRLQEKMGWLDIDPSSIRHILITHQDTDHVGAVERDSDGLFRDAKLYLSEIENRYLTGEVRRKVSFGLYKLPLVETDNPKALLQDGQVLEIGGIRIEAILVPGHTWGHMVYLIDDAYLFTGDTIWFGADGGYSFINALAEDNELSKKSLAALKAKLEARGLSPMIITGHTGWTADRDFAFAHIDEVCAPAKKVRVHDPAAPYDGYDESEDTEENARHKKLGPVVQHPGKAEYANWMPRGMVAGAAAGTAALLAADAFVLGNSAIRATVPGKAAAAVLTAGVIGAGAFTVYSHVARKAFSYDGDRKLSKQIIEGIAEYVRIPDGGTGLDVGCGSGALTIACAKCNPKASMVGIDPWGPGYREFTRTVCERNAKTEGADNTFFEPGNAIQLEYPDGTFDAVTSNYVYHNISGKDRQKLLLETLRVLKKGGTFAIHDLMTRGRFGDMQAFAGKLVQQGYEKVCLIDTTRGEILYQGGPGSAEYKASVFFQNRAEAVWLMLGSSTLLVGKK